MKKIIPHLWFDKEAIEATNFYISLFPNSKITAQSVVRNTPSGDCDTLAFELGGEPFMAISAGPFFKANPSISFHVKCQTKEEVDQLWSKLSVGGKALMEIGTYAFSERYGWVQDKYGFSWQLIYTGDQTFTQKITPILMYTQDLAGKCEEALNFYTTVFKSEKPKILARYDAGAAPDKEGTVTYAHFKLLDSELGAMDSAQKHDFKFNEAISLLIPCDTQKEIDYYWDKLTEGGDPNAQQCGWLKDRFGVSWQVWPIIAGKMLSSGTPEQVDKVTKAFLQMKKFDIAELERAYKA